MSTKHQWYIAYHVARCVMSHAKREELKQNFSLFEPALGVLNERQSQIWAASWRKSSFGLHLQEHLHWQHRWF